MNYKLWFWIVNIVSSVLRFLVISKINIITGETYCQHTNFLDLFHFDHSLITAYLTKASILIFGNNEFAARFPTALIFFFICWIFFICAKKLYNERTAFTGVLLLNILPTFSLLEFVITLPNSLFILFWISSLLIFITLIETDNKNYWYLLGIITGFATLLGYNIALISFSIFISLIILSQHRSWFKRKEPYLALIIIPSLTFLPAIILNIENISLNYNIGILLPKFSPILLETSLGAQACYASPFLFLIFIIVALLCVKEVYQKKNRAAIIIACFSFPALLPPKGITTFNGILPQWTAGGYLVLSIYAAHLTLKFWHIKWCRVYSYATWGFALFTLTTVSLHLCQIGKFLPINQRHVVSQPEKIYIKNELYDWKNTVRIINQKGKPFTFSTFRLYKSYPTNKLASSDNINAYGIWKKYLDPHTANVLEPEKDFCQKLIEFDHSVFKFVNSSLKSKFLDFYISLISYCDSKCSNLSFFVMLIVSIGTLWNNKKERFWTDLILLVGILAIGTAITFFLKHYFERLRPLKVLGDKNINTFFEETYHNDAFPSGHTQIVFSICTFMFIVVKKYWYWYFILDLVVSFERIYEGYHFPSDVLAGAVIGIISAYATVTLFRKYFKI
jgi:membrane-associated phospholipid phosphatase